MTPGARIAAATEILDTWNEGEAVEKLLTNWGRRSRFAGSKDRAAVRDLVFDALRNLNRYAAIGKGRDGRALMIGRLFALGEDPDHYFTGEGYMPEALSDDERLQGDTTGVVNLQEWILPKMQDSLGSDFEANEKALCHRAPLFLRVNTQQTNVEEVIARLAKEQIIARPHSLSPTALEVTENPRRFAGSEVFRTGLAEIQDAASQAVSDLVPVKGRVLDFCAGGGGKSLALAARGATVVAHDISQARMRDIPERARRAGVHITQTDLKGLKAQKPFETVFADAPCSGSGSWRRDPEGKWRLSQARLIDILEMQAEVLRTASGFVAQNGGLAYATCSVLRDENEIQCERFLAENPGWKAVSQHRFTPVQGGDGFFLMLMQRG